MNTMMRRFLQTDEKTKTILSTFSGNYSVDDLQKQIVAYVNLLQEKDIKGKRVGLLVPNVISYLSLAMAVNQLGGIIVPISWQYRSEDLSEVLKLLDPHIVFTVTTHGGFSFLDVIDQWAKSSENYTLVYHSEDCFQWKVISYGALDKSLEDSKIDIICCTSGSTGLPKALMLTMDSMEFSVQFLKEIYDMKSSDRMFMMAPPTSVFGIVSLLSGLREGIQIVYPDAFELPIIVKQLRETKTNKIVTTPSILKAIYPFVKQMAPEIIDNLDLCSLSGEFVTEEITKLLPLNEQCMYLGVYGISEMGGVLYCDLRKKAEWSVYPGVEYKTADDGEFLIRSSGAFIGYYKQPNLTSQVWSEDGWFHTGDLVKVNENGKLEIIGRKKDLIKKGGQQVAPGEVEKVLLQHPKVQQATVLGAPHPVYGEQVVAFVVVNDGSSVKELYPFCADRLARYKVPDAIEIISEIPITQGKTDKLSLRNLFLARKG